MKCTYCESEIEGIGEKDRHWRLVTCETCGKRSWAIVLHGIYLVTREREDSPVIVRGRFGGTMFRIVEVTQGHDKDLVRYQAEAWRSEERTEIVTTPTSEPWRAVAAMAGAATVAMVQREHEIEEVASRVKYDNEPSSIAAAREKAFATSITEFRRLMNWALDLGRGLPLLNDSESVQFEEKHGW